MKKNRVSKIKQRLSYYGDTYFLSDYQYTLRRYKEVFGYIPNLKDPKTFNEKINWRKLYDRRKIFKTFADKWESKELIKKRFGEKLLPEVFQLVDAVEDLNFSDLPRSFVVKATHGSGWVKIVYDKDKEDLESLKNFFEPILNKDYYRKGREWAYKGLKKRLIVEEFLNDVEGQIPIDYKFFCFNGVVKFVQLDFNRFSGHTRLLINRGLEIIPCSYIYPSYDIDFKPPSNWSSMVNLAEEISKGLDFIRVDLFSISEEIYFGELTLYPENGIGRFKPDKFDLKFGKYWEIK